MSATQPLTGNALIDCARANASFAIDVAARQSGYNDNVQEFRHALKQACEGIGIEEIRFADLHSKADIIRRSKGVEIAPDNATQL